MLDDLIKDQVAEEITEDLSNPEYAKDVLGITNVNLHRRIDTDKDPDTDNSYVISKISKNSYVTITSEDITETDNEDEIS